MTIDRGRNLLLGTLVLAVILLTIITIHNFSALTADQNHITQLAIANHTNSQDTLHQAVMAIQRQRYDLSLSNCQAQNTRYQHVVTTVGQEGPEGPGLKALLIARAAIPPRDCLAVAQRALKVVGPPVPKPLMPAK